MAEGSGNSKHWLWLVVAAVVLVLILIGVFPARVEEPPAPSPVEARPPAGAPVETPGSEPSKTPTRSEAVPSLPSDAQGQADGEDDADGNIPFLDRDQERAFRWAQVDLDAVRNQMPENLYWKLGAPTNDPAVLREREEERARWNDAYGQVLAGTASAGEIQDYYAQRHRLSSDYVEFGSHLLEQYGDVLPARDLGLLEFSVKMHRSRLQQMPRRLVEALERKDKQDRLREAWLADEEAFEQALANPDEDPDPEDTASADAP